MILSRKGFGRFNETTAVKTWPDRRKIASAGSTKPKYASTASDQVKKKKKEIKGKL